MSVRKLAIALVLLLPLSCGRECHGHDIEGWCVEGDAPVAFLDEIRVCTRITGQHGERIQIYDAPYACGSISPNGLCSGSLSYELGEIAVVYAPRLGLGPGVGTTALEHEFCHMAVGTNDKAADDCTAELTTRVKAELDP